MKQEKMGHVLAIPFPLQGHINPIMQLCTRLISYNIRVTMITTQSLTTSLQRINADHINFETVPDTTINGPSTGYYNFLVDFVDAITAGLPDIINKHSNSSHPPTAVLYDSLNPWILDIAHGKGLKGAALFTQSCIVSAVYYHVHRGSLEIPHEEVCLPCMPVMGIKDLPSFVYHMDSHPDLLKILVDQHSAFEQADWRLFNTFDNLEEETLKWMSRDCPIQTIGPIIPSMYTDKRIPGNYDYGLSFFKSNMESYMQWMDEKEDRSVIYVSFGSLAHLPDKQMEEVARGLIDSQCNFLWVVRDSEQSKLPKDLVSMVKEKGLIVNWVAQLRVLSHRAVGCFLTHCGWNSTLEAMSVGVPMVAMPHWSDQPTNAKLISDVWKIGVRVEADGNGVVPRDEVAARVKEVMKDGGRGDELRKTASNLKDLAVKAVSEGGSSDKNIMEFATQLLNI